MLEPALTVKLYQRPPSPQTFAQGKVIFAEEEQGELMYGIISGEVEMSVKGQIVEIIKEGDIFGQGALVHQDHKRTSTAFSLCCPTNSYVCSGSNAKLFRPLSSFEAFGHLLVERIILKLIIY